MPLFLVPGSFSTCWTSSKQESCQKVHFLGGEERIVHSDGRSQVCAAGCGGSPTGETTVYTWRTARPPRRVCGTRSQTRRCGDNVRSPWPSPLGSPPVSTRRTATSLTTCGLLPPPLPSSHKPPPRSQRRWGGGARCTPPSISLVISRSGAAAEDCVGLGSFPRSDYPGLLGGNEPQPLEAFAAAAAAPSLPHPPHLLSLQTHYCSPPLFLDLVTSQFSSKMPRRPV